MILKKPKIFKDKTILYIKMTSYQVEANEFTADNVSCTKPRTNKKTKRLQTLLLYAYENGQAPLYFETPESLVVPFGLSSYEQGDNTGKYDYSLPMICSSSDTKEQNNVTRWFEQLKAMDEFMIDFGVQYSKEIFGQEYTKDQRMIVEALYSRMIKKPKVNKDTGEPYPERIQPKVMKQWEETPSSTNGVPGVEVYTTSEIPETIDSWEELQEVIPKGGSVTAIIQPRVWFVSGKFGTTLRILKLKVTPRDKHEIPRGYTFSKRLTSDDTTTKTTTSYSVEAEVSAKASTEASEEEEYEELEDEEDEVLDSDEEVEEVEEV